MTGYIRHLKENITERIFKIEFLDKYGQVTGEDTINIISGNINTKLQANARRSCSLVFQNSEGSYVPDEDSNFWLDKQFRLYTGLKINDEEHYNLRGTFVVGNPVLASNFAEVTASIEGLDKWLMLDGTLGGTLEDAYVINKSTSIPVAVRAIFQAAGEPMMPIIHDTDAVTPNPIIKEIGDTYADMLTELAGFMSWDIFYDEMGHPRFQPPINVETQGVVWHFSDKENLYLGGTRTPHYDKLKNVVKVIGDNINNAMVVGIAEEDNILSPVSTHRLDRRIVHVVFDDIIDTVPRATIRAKYELTKLVALQNSINIKCVPVDILSEGDIITLTDSKLYLNRDRLQIQSISESLRYNGEMTIEAWQAQKF